MPNGTEKPLPFKDLDKHFTPRDPRKKTPITLERHFHITADHEPVVKTRLERVSRNDNQNNWEVIVEVDGVRAGGRALAPALRGKATKIQSAK